jgi:hypothetical protein
MKKEKTMEENKKEFLMVTEREFLEAFEELVKALTKSSTAYPTPRLDKCNEVIRKVRLVLPKREAFRERQAKLADIYFGSVLGKGENDE